MAERILSLGRAVRADTTLHAERLTNLSRATREAAELKLSIRPEHRHEYFSVRGIPFVALPYQIVSASDRPFVAGSRLRGATRNEVAEAYADQISTARFRQSMLHAADANARAASPTHDANGIARRPSPHYERTARGGLLLRTELREQEERLAGIARSIALADLWYADLRRPARGGSVCREVAPVLTLVEPAHSTHA